MTMAGAPKNEAGAPEIHVANAPAGKGKIAVGAEKAQKYHYRQDKVTIINRSTYQATKIFWWVNSTNIAMYER